MRRWVFCFCLCLQLCAPSFAAAAISIEADQLEAAQDGKSYRASGRVRITDGPLLLQAEEVLWQQQEGRAQAEGGVWMDTPEFFLEGKRLDFLLHEKLGTIEDARIYMRQPAYRIRGERIEKLGPDEFRIEQGTFTLCEGEVPDWKFGASRIDITRGGYARARNAVFYLSDIPVFYLPYLIYPVKTERESGFLTPSVGFSEEKGVQLSVAYYQVLGRNRDATLYLDYYTRMGLGTGLEYRYVEAMDNEGVFELYHIGGRNEVPNATAWRLEHLGNLPGELSLIADIEYVTDEEYFEEFGDEARDYNKELVESTLALTRRWGGLSLTGELVYLKDLERDNDLTLQRLPELTLRYQRTPLGGPFSAEFEAVGTHFWRREGLTGTRLTARPALLATVYPTPYLEVSPELGYRVRAYETSHEGPGYEHDGIYDFSTRVSTRLSRVFSMERASLEKVQHSIEPEVTWLFTPNEDQERLPFFDPLDRIEAQNRIAYALVNRLTARFTGPGGDKRYHEWAYLRISGDYDIALARDGGEDPFSEILTELILRPAPGGRLEADVSYDPEENLMTSLNFSAQVQPDPDLGLGVTYRYTRDLQEYLEGEVRIPWLRPLYVTYRGRHDLQEGSRLEDIVDLEWRDPCWSVFFTISDRPEEKKFMLSFTLSELGEIARVGGDLGSDLGGWRD